MSTRHFNVNITRNDSNSVDQDNMLFFFNPLRNKVTNSIQIWKIFHTPIPTMKCNKSWNIWEKIQPRMTWRFSLIFKDFVDSLNCAFSLTVTDNVSAKKLFFTVIDTASVLKKSFKIQDKRFNLDVSRIFNIVKIL